MFLTYQNRFNQNLTMLKLKTKSSFNQRFCYKSREDNKVWFRCLCLVTKVEEIKYCVFFIVFFLQP